MFIPLILPPPPSPLPLPTTFIPSAGPLTRDVGPKYNSLASAERTLPLPFLQGCGQLILFPQRIWGSTEELGTGKYQGGTYNVSGVVNNKDLRERVHDRHVTGMLEYERGGNLIRYASLLHPHPSPRVVVTPFFICYLVIQQLPLKHP